MESLMEKHPVKILIVDDKKENLLSLQVILAGQGYEFVEASSGKDALRILLKNQDFAIILMDVQMPLMDGFETAELIRQSDKLKHVPIIFLTANMDTSDYIFKGYQSGAVDYMIKPLSSEILKAKVLVFTELYKKNKELQLKEEETAALNHKIVKANEKLAQQYAAIEKYATELKQKNAELDAFTQISSHDLQEPLRKIQTFSNMILTKEYSNLSEDGKSKFDRILYAANRMRNLINDLLVFSQASTTEHIYEHTDLSVIIENVKEALSENIKDKKAVITTELHGKIYIIPFLFVQLLENLTNNALKFSQKDIPLTIEIKSRMLSGQELENEKLQPEQNYCHIAFKDNGIGFDSQHSEKIFGVFQRLHSRDDYDGTGIGLAIVKKIVDNHNGIITATGKHMEGATFHIYIPQ
ncbi:MULTISPECIES: sensor histidine kinase [unclassified Flavobacterium]|jgi:signal transduction histidine kinase|uniref:sensor histidine kinase n=1 Tax=unclassified Flavobacterium TaxID=196869 RepID=UPI001065CE5E|nr:MULTISPECIES: response regulator [unclassified Flavobacterium]MDQ1166065.1 signal transduction histidine kinase [Flavobacterium sp. SORGH_AS_0622]TDX08394.1 phospho-acceptor domain-containing protein [Flavobacterium sp. S87F.05.LMB.W.Kidney.N]